MKIDKKKTFVYITVGLIFFSGLIYLTKEYTTLLWNKFEKESIGFSIKYPEGVNTKYFKEDLAHNLNNTENCYVILNNNYYIYLKFNLNTKGCTTNTFKLKFDSLEEGEYEIEGERYRLVTSKFKDDINAFSKNINLSGVNINYGVGFDKGLSDEKYNIATKEVEKIISTIKITEH